VAEMEAMKKLPRFGKKLVGKKFMAGALNKTVFSLTVK
jgi:hypothetical protein